MSYYPRKEMAPWKQRMSDELEGSRFQHYENAVELVYKGVVWVLTFPFVSL